MEALFKILFGALAFFIFIGIWHRARAAKVQQPLVSVDTVEAAAESTPANTSGSSLVDKLRDLSSRLEPFAQEAAHPGEVAEHADFKVARDIFASPDTPLYSVVNYATGASISLSYPALAALVLRPDRQDASERISAHFEHFPAWGVYYALLYFDSLEFKPSLGELILRAASEYWASNNWITTIFRDALERRSHLGDLETFGEDAAPPNPERAAAVRSFLAAIDHPSTRLLLSELDELKQGYIDYAFLNSFGRLWEHKSLASLIITPGDWKSALDQAPELVKRKPARSLLVVGESLVGKTTLLRLLAHRLIGDGWQVFEAGGAALMAGQQWFGQLEERIRRVTSEVTVEKKLVWYIPDLLQLARSGTHSGQSASILEQIMPAMTTGQIVVWTEASPAALTRLLQMQPGLRSLLELARLEPMDAGTTRPIAREVGARLANALDVTVDPRCVDVAIESAVNYLSHSHLPGSAISLLKLAMRQAGQEAGAEIGPPHVIHTLSQLTGLPESILDATEKLDLKDIRAFFSSRVMGQEEAVNAVVDRIAMLKAGLNDPGKPVGVFLFAGPTGTGKTELAKTMAEFLFGSSERMIRLDMSEFQTPDSIAKIMGDGLQGETGSLIARVRKQPFSVVLLDEFEKSWSGIWDLFLQVFDDGRLSDPAGQVADFRHCLIILTSNLGATAHRSGGFGFAPPGDMFSSDQVLRAIAQTYRPEFQNRIDRVIVFRPLDRELMRGILRKELDDVLTRRGLKDRDWAVEWEASALEFLLEKGFTPEMGARPLKRAIDRYLLAPLAATIVERKFPEGEQFLFVRSDGKTLQAEFVDPDAGDFVEIKPSVVAAQAPPALSPGAILLSARGNEEEFSALTHYLQEIDARLHAPHIDALKDDITSKMSANGFWDDPLRHAILARYALIDRVMAAYSTAEHLQARLAATSSKSERRPREVMSRLALQVYLLQKGLEDILDDAPVEVAVSAEVALDGASADRTGALNWCNDVLKMYRVWAGNRNMQIEEINKLPGRDLDVLAVSGFGAARMLSREAGLHVLESEDGSSRFAARINVAPTPLGDLATAQRRGLISRALDETERSNIVVRRYRREGAAQGSHGPSSSRTVGVEDALKGQFDLVAPAQR